MINTKFEAYKLSRELKRSGINFTIRRYTQNEFKEPSSDETVIGCFTGLYHEQNSNVQINTGEAIQTRTKKIPMILCLYDDIKNYDIHVGDEITYNSSLFKITGIVNIQEWNIICDISLEVVDIANKA